MEDRELLELAAKAAGINLRWPIDPESDLCARREDNWNIWNPLTDDGDALRLALKRGIYVMVVEEEGLVSARARNGLRTSYIERIAGDADVAVQAAARRAIVRAVVGNYTEN